MEMENASIFELSRIRQNQKWSIAQIDSDDNKSHCILSWINIRHNK